MKRIRINTSAALIFLLSLLSIFALSACSVEVLDPERNVDNTNFSAVESFLFDVAVSNQKRLNLSAVNGPIDVVGVPVATAMQIWGERRVGSESVADAQAHLSDLEVRVTDTQNEVTVKTVQPDNSHGRNYQVTYHVRLPIHWKIVINNVNGDVRIDSLENDLSINLVNGNVWLREIYGSVSVELVNGQIDAKLRLPVQGSCRMSAVNGNIQLAIPQSTSAEFSAAVTNGGISLSNLVLKNSVGSPTSLRGTLAGGQGTIALVVVNGRIGVVGF
ncbi:MAG: DUF4097 family beta strand repeat-containing protein [candidate division KSB1 bacterium]|nr:DUF4097 family beta strand repeat-containing protein [candidate division KSB1 bacterium]MDZ7300767.1 DUF4097 family beta strand repeat-containing protein [candidate division KSB1 bacterium]MDZ7309963.1 DUF4097 family beta strand repeat-containing protein [candidate division KSB1 bacterium]